MSRRVGRVSLCVAQGEPQLHAHVGVVQVGVQERRALGDALPHGVAVDGERRGRAVPTPVQGQPGTQCLGQRGRVRDRGEERAGVRRRLPGVEERGESAARPRGGGRAGRGSPSPGSGRGRPARRPPPGRPWARCRSPPSSSPPAATTSWSAGSRARTRESVASRRGVPRETGRRGRASRSRRGPPATCRRRAAPRRPAGSSPSRSRTRAAERARLGRRLVFAREQGEQDHRDPRDGVVAGVAVADRRPQRVALAAAQRVRRQLRAAHRVRRRRGRGEEAGLAGAHDPHQLRHRRAHLGRRVGGPPGRPPCRPAR